jgi:bacterioferritin-associated ferredoxin
MHKDENVCVCHKVSLGKLHSFILRVDPKVPSQLSECLDAGTSCGWCIPFLKKIHEQHIDGKDAEVELSAEQYLQQRISYLKEKKAKRQNDG